MSQNSPQTSTSVERDEPTAGSSGVPVAFILLLGLMSYWGLNYVDGHGGWFNPNVYEPFTTLDEVSASQPHDPEGDFYLLGKKTFEGSCILCHQADGAGKAGQFPPLAGSDWLNAASPNRIGRIVLNGLSGPITVQGGPNGTVNLNASMAPLGGTYKDEELAAALSYVRQQWGNKSSKITPEQIKAIRAAIKDHPGPFAPSELSQIPLQ